MVSDGLWMGLLGPFEVRLEGVLVGPGGARRRGLLAVLAAEPNVVQPVASVIDRLWGEAPPASAVNVVQTYVSAWRKVLGGADGPLATVGGGYRLALSTEHSDLLTFRSLATRARTVQGRDAADCWRAALDLWRGPALADLDGEAFHAELAAPLEAERARAVEQWAEAALAVGHDPDDVLALLLEAQARDPLRESTTVMVLKAHALAGRQASALAAYDVARQRLAEELGTIPGPALRDMHQRILQGDPDLLPDPETARRATSVLASTSRDSAPADRFFGRAEELVDVAALLAAGRLVTLTGPGGSGKTRLAHEVLDRHLEPGGLGWFVELAPVRDSVLAASAVASTLGLGVAAGTDPADMLTSRLADVRGLLVLDNAEHLPGLASFVRRLHRTCRDLRILVTSRQPLQVEGEQQYGVPVLPVPASGDLADVVSQSSVELLTDRVRALDPAFQVTEDNAVDVMRIVRHLDGLPLAIEIVAPWVRLQVLLPWSSGSDRAASTCVADAATLLPGTGPCARPSPGATRWSVTPNAWFSPPGGLPGHLRRGGGRGRLRGRVHLGRGGAARPGRPQPRAGGDPGVGSGSVPDARRRPRVRARAARRGPGPRRGARPHAGVVLGLGDSAGRAQRGTGVAGLARSGRGRGRQHPGGRRALLRPRPRLRAAPAGRQRHDPVVRGRSRAGGRGAPQSALDRAGGTAPARAIGLTYWAWLRATRDRAGAAAAASEARDLAVAAGDVPVEAFALQTLGDSLADPGEAEAASRAALKACDRAEGMTVSYGPTAPDAVRCGASASIAIAWTYRSLPEALHWQTEALRRAELEGDRRITAVNCARLAHLHLLAGDVSPASALVARARGLVSARVSARWEDTVALADALLARHEGRSEDAGRILRETASGAAAAGRVLHAVLGGVALADLCLDDGRPSDAADALDRAQRVGALTDPAHLARLEVRRARVDREQDRPDEARRRLEALAGYVETVDGMPPECSSWLIEMATLDAEAGREQEALAGLDRLREGLAVSGVQLPPWEVSRLDALKPGSRPREK